MPTTTISPHAKIGALVGVLLTVLAGAAFYILHGHHSQPAPVVTPTPTPAQHHPTPKPVTVVKPVVNSLLPAPVHMALEHFPRVVVAFYNPNDPVARLTVDEARAGATADGVRFFAVSLLDDSVAGPLTALLPAGELLPDPGFIVYKRPGTVAYRSDGYLDRAAVAQAVKVAK